MCRFRKQHRSLLNSSESKCGLMRRSRWSRFASSQSTNTDGNGPWAPCCSIWQWSRTHLPQSDVTSGRFRPPGSLEVHVLLTKASRGRLGTKNEMLHKCFGKLKINLLDALGLTTFWMFEKLAILIRFYNLLQPHLQTVGGHRSVWMHQPNAKHRIRHELALLDKPSTETIWMSKRGAQTIGSKRIVKGQTWTNKRQAVAFLVGGDFL